MPIIGDFKLRELFLPATHDAGTCEMEIKLFEHWTQDQTICIDEQMKVGSRGFDLRPGDFGPTDDPDQQFKFYHGNFAGKRYESVALQAFKSFTETQGN